MYDLKSDMAAVAAAVEELIGSLLPIPPGAEGKAVEAMRYSAMGGGKRLRPLLAVASARLFDEPEERAVRAGVAVEMIHCYSLIHDDLPAMDDSDLRRGRPTVHKAFDEATAVLAGDCLLTHAFEVLADSRTHPDPAVRCALITALARASGTEGMAGGQMIDLDAENKTLDMAGITRLQALKTGALFRYSCEAGAILAEAPQDARAALIDYARDMGLSFQVADDLLDAEGSEADIGKPTGQDAAAGKATFVSLLGIEGARQKADELHLKAVSHLDLFGKKADCLRSIARFVIERRN